MSGVYKPDFQPDVEKGLNRFKKRLVEEQHTSPESLKVASKWNWLRYAAALVLLAASALVVQHIFFGHAGTIRVATLEGETKTVALADGSTIWLNERTTLTYPAAFDGRERNVALSGEAYFEIKPNADMPFTVRTSEVRVEVLGTAFNLREYPGVPVCQVNVMHGKVRFQPNISEKSLILVGGEQGRYFPKRKVLRKNISASKNADSWKTGKLQFNNTPLQTVLTEIEHHYAVPIRLENKAMNTCGFTSNFDHADIKTVIKTLEKAFGFTAHLQKDGSYLLRMGQCG